MTMTRRRLLDDTFKKSVVGNPAIATDSLARMYPGITMQGWTEQAKTTGANLVDYTQAIPRNGSQSVEIIDGGVKWTGNYYFEIPVAGLKKNQNYIMSYESDDAGIWVFSYSDGTFSSNAFNGHSNTTDPEKDCSAVYIYKSDPAVTGQDMVFTNIMLNKDTTALPYEPYTGGQPSPSPDYPQEIVSSGNWDETAQKWEYEINMAGAQLFDESDIQVVSIDPEGTQRNGFEITGLKPGQYTISTKKKTIGTIGYLYVKVKNSSGDYGKAQYIVTNVNIDTVTISIRSGDTFIIYDASSSNSMEVSKDIFSEYGIMLNIGSVALPYQPYHTPQSIILQSDRPLTKWDRLEKRNGQWGWMYKSDTAVFDGSEEWSLYSTANAGTVFYTALPNASFGLQTSLCDKYRNINSAWSSSYNGVFGIYSDHSSQLYKYFRPPSAAVETVEQWKAWLSENPLTVLLETSTETFVPLTASEQEQMNNLYTYRPTTVLSNQQDCEMALTYKTRKSMEVTA